jgi:hypothetical protein
MKDEDFPLYVLGMSDDEFFSEFIISKFQGVLKRLQKVYSKIDEVRLTIEKTSSEGKRQNYQVTSLIFTPYKTHTYKQTGWDLSNVCQNLGQRLLRNLSKRRKNRSRQSIRKISEKIF